MLPHPFIALSNSLVSRIDQMLGCWMSDPDISLPTVGSPLLEDSFTMKSQRKRRSSWKSFILWQKTPKAQWYRSSATNDAQAVWSQVEVSVDMSVLDSLILLLHPIVLSMLREITLAVGAMEPTQQQELWSLIIRQQAQDNVSLRELSSISLTHTLL